MNLKLNDKPEFETQYTTGAITKLKKALKCKNLRKTLLESAANEDYEVLETALQAFSGGAVKETATAGQCIDTYIRENAVSAYEMFLTLIVEIGESGFFKEKMSLEELRERMQNPAADIDMSEITASILEEFKGAGAKELAKAMMTGADTLTTFGQPLMPPA